MSSDESHGVLGVVMLVIVAVLGLWVSAALGISLPLIGSPAAHLSAVGLHDLTGRPNSPTPASTPTPAVAVLAAAIQRTPTPDVVLPQAAVPQAPGCAPGQQPAFPSVLAQLKQRLGATMGEPLECAHPGQGNGDFVQRTSTGLAVIGKADGRAQFTDGYHHWVLSPNGVDAWEGNAAPPAAGATPGPLQQGARAHVANTDGEGVILRASAKMEDRTKRALREGTHVTILEQQGSDWARVRSDTGAEGWVPAKYLAPGN